MIRVGIIGATGYTGAELIRLLMSHNNAVVTTLTSRQYSGEIFSNIYPALRKTADIIIDEYDPGKISENCDVVFTALPHKIPMEIIPELLERNIKVIDLSADFRFSSIPSYEEYYCKHTAPDLVDDSVYGLCEIYKDDIKGASLIGNPGCYPTCSLLGIIPMLELNVAKSEDIIIDAKSGVSGAGRGLSIGTHFCEVNEGFKAYKVASHRHRPEIEEKLKRVCNKDVKISFTPHLIPGTRGMLATIYMKSDFNKDIKFVKKELTKFYSESHFIRILPGDEMPNIKNVAGTNYCDMNICFDENGGRIIIVSAIDNLIKGASGQAIQNMNLMFGFDEREGLFNTAYPV